MSVSKIGYLLFISNRFEVHLKLYCTHLTVHSLYCPVQYSQDLRERYPGYGCPNVPALTVQISVPSRLLCLMFLGGLPVDCSTHFAAKEYLSLTIFRFGVRSRQINLFWDKFSEILIPLVSSVSWVLSPTPRISRESGTVPQTLLWLDLRNVNCGKHDAYSDIFLNKQ